MIDFFDSKYLTEPVRTDSQFGICDNGRLAYTTTQGDNAKWMAVVSNEDQKTLQFVECTHYCTAHNNCAKAKWVFVQVAELVLLYLEKFDNLFGSYFYYIININKRKHPLCC